MSSQIFPLDSHSQTNSHIVIWRSDRFVSSSSSMRFTGQQVLFPVCNLYFYCVYNSHAYCSLYNHTPSHRALCSQTRWQETHLTCIFIFVFIVTFQKFPSNLPDNSMQLSSFVCLLLHCSALTSLSCCLILLCSVYCRGCRILTFVSYLFLAAIWCFPFLKKYKYDYLVQFSNLVFLCYQMCPAEFYWVKSCVSWREFITETHWVPPWVFKKMCQIDFLTHKTSQRRLFLIIIILLAFHLHMPKLCIIKTAWNCVTLSLLCYNL